METQTFTQTVEQTVEQFQTAFKSSFDIYTKNTVNLLEAYNQQLNIAFDFYKNFIASALVPEVKKNYKSQLEKAKQGVETFKKSIIETLGLSKEAVDSIIGSYTSQNQKKTIPEGLTDSVLKIYQKQAELTRDFNVQFLDAAGKEFTLTSSDYKTLAKRFSSAVQQSITDSEGNIKKLLESYNKNTEFSVESTDSLIKNINTQFDNLAEVNIKFWNELIKAISQTPVMKTNGNVPAGKENLKA